MDLEQVLEQAPGCTRARRRRAATCATPTSSCCLCAAARRSARRGSCTSTTTPRSSTRSRSARPPAGGGVADRRHEPGRPARDAPPAAHGLDRRRVLGYTLNDSLRLRTGLAQGARRRAGQRRRLGARRARRLGVPLSPRRGRRRAGASSTRRAARGRARTTCATGTPPRRARLGPLVDLDVRPRRRAHGRRDRDGAGELWPASVRARRRVRHRRASRVSVPVTLGRGGVEQIHEWDLADEELAALHASAEFVRAAASRIG